MGPLQVQSNGGDGGGEGLLADDPGYVEVDPTGRYGRVRSTGALLLPPHRLLLLVIVFALLSG